MSLACNGFNDRVFVSVPVPVSTPYRVAPVARWKIAAGGPRGRDAPECREDAVHGVHSDIAL